MSSRIPLPSAGARRRDRSPDNRDVVALVGVSGFALLAVGATVVQAVHCARPRIDKTRGLETIFASCGAATGTLITSIRNSACSDLLRRFT